MLAAPARVPGIDVSKWQLDVDWAQVAASPVRYVIMRATIGNTPTMPRSIDPRYEEYLAGATANGLVVGAYHRAHVGPADGDAVGEADHFVDNARIAAGDVLPVLDIEETHGLGPAAMRDWVKAWVRRVFARTGVKPMLYASPYFWRTAMGDTTWFADRGYPLWIAHWGVPSPDVPANDWGGRGWTYWQWTSTGTVPGISTDVDRDRFDGASLTGGLIASLTVDPPAGGTIAGARIACGGAGLTCARLANPRTPITLAALPDPGAVLLRWTGACAPAGASPTCEVTLLGAKEVSAVFGYPVRVERRGTGDGTVTSSPAGLACGTSCTELFPAGTVVELTAQPDSASAFDGWAGACAGSDPCSIAVAAPTDVVATFDSTVSVEQDGAGTRFAWGRATHPVAIGGSFRWERRAGATATYAFSGRAVTISVVKGPAMGRGRIAIDGVPVAVLDGYARTMRSAWFRFPGLDPGDHTITVEVLGTKRAAARGTRVSVDALRWGGVTRADPATASATWSEVADAAASGGSSAISDAAGASSWLRFEGTGVSLRARRGPSMGRAEVWVDGSLERIVDLYAPATAFTTIRLVAGLADGPHTVRIVVSGTHRAASGGDDVTLDRWIVR